MRREQQFGYRSAEFRHRIRPGASPSLIEEQLARQRVSVCVQAGRGEPEQPVSHPDGVPSISLGPIHDADDEAGQIVFAGRVEIGHLGGFSADKRAAHFPAAARKPGDNLLHHPGSSVPQAM